jgi:hypothetical protein
VVTKSTTTSKDDFGTTVQSQSSKIPVSTQTAEDDFFKPISASATSKPEDDFFKPLSGGSGKFITVYNTSRTRKNREIELSFSLILSQYTSISLLKN